MKRNFTLKHFSMLFLFPLLLGGCYWEQQTVIGPPGLPGLAYFGIDYQISHPYSYWDDNPSVPYNPLIGTYYLTNPGIYNFEYFINENEFWYGTYEIYVNLGQPGGPYDTPGANGLDTYLMLICDSNGYHEIRSVFKNAEGQEEIVVEKREGKHQYKITMKKGDPATHQTHAPKYIRK